MSGQLNSNSNFNINHNTDENKVIKDAREASTILKTLANPNRLAMLQILKSGERNVGSLEEIMGLRQPTISQQLARLKSDGFVSSRRDGKQIYYRLASDQVTSLVSNLNQMVSSNQV